MLLQVELCALFAIEGAEPEVTVCRLVFLAINAVLIVRVLKPFLKECLKIWVLGKSASFEKLNVY